jgi:hypothetical protein
MNSSQSGDSALVVVGVFIFLTLAAIAFSLNTCAKELGGMNASFAQIAKIFKEATEEKHEEHIAW